MFKHDESNLVFFSNLLLPPLSPPPPPPSPSALALFSALRGSVVSAAAAAVPLVPLVPLPLETTLPLQPRTTAVAFGFFALSF